MFADGRTYGKNITRPTSMSPLVAEIADGSYRRVDANVQTILDASTSRDPDTSTTAVTTGVFSWICSRRLSSSNGVWTPCPGALHTTNTSVLVVRAGYLTPDYDQEFTVVFRVGNRNATASTVLVALDQPVPLISITGPSQVSLGQEIRLLTSAYPSPLRPESDQERLAYSWLETTDLLVSNLTGRTSASLVLNTATLGMAAGSVYEFECVVTDLITNTFASAKTRVSVFAPPIIRNLTVTPSSGFAFLDRFMVQPVDVKGIGELEYRFSFEKRSAITSHQPFVSNAETRLSSFTSKPTLQTVLPEGDLVLTVYVRDSMGGITSISATNVSVRALPSVGSDDSGIEATEECKVFNSTLVAIRTILGQAEGLHTMITSQRSICNSVGNELEVLVAGGLYDEALRTINFLHGQIDKIPRSSTPLSSCSAIVAYNFTGCAAVGSSEDSATFSNVKDALWFELEAQLDFVVSKDVVSTRSGGQAIQNLLLLSGSAASAVRNGTGGAMGDNAVFINSSSTLVRLLDKVLDDVDSYELDSTNSGQEAADTISNLVHMNSGGSIHDNSKADKCTSLDGATRLVDKLLIRTGEMKVPSSIPRVFSTSSFTATTRSIFADSSTELSTQNAQIRLPASASETNYTRPVVTLAITEWSRELGDCRQDRNNGSGNGGKLNSPILSVTLGGEKDDNKSSHTYFSGNGVLELLLPLDSTPECLNHVSCEYWETSTGEWNSSACEFQGLTESGQARCSCRHLTEFAVIERRKFDPCTPMVDSVSELDVTIYTASASVFSLLFVIAIIQLSRLTMAGKLYQNSQVAIPHTILAAQCAARVLSGIFFGDWGATAGFGVNTAHSAIVVMISALPYTLSSWCVSLIIFQWIAISHNKRMSRKPFERFKIFYIIMNVIATVIGWTLFGVAVTHPDPSIRSVASKVGAGCLAGLSLIVAMFGLIYGIRMDKIVGSAGKSAASARRSLQVCTALLTTCYVIQTTAWMLSSYMAIDMDPGWILSSLTATFLFAECLGVIAQLNTYKAGVTSAIDGGSSLSKKRRRRSSNRKRGSRLSHLSRVSTEGNKKGADRPSELGTSFQSGSVTPRTSALSTLGTPKLSGRTSNYLRRSSFVRDVKRIANSLTSSQTAEAKLGRRLPENDWGTSSMVSSNISSPRSSIEGLVFSPTAGGHRFSYASPRRSTESVGGLDGYRGIERCTSDESSIASSTIVVKSSTPSNISQVSKAIHRISEESHRKQETPKVKLQNVMPSPRLKTIHGAEIKSRQNKKPLPRTKLQHLHVLDVMSNTGTGKIEKSIIKIASSLSNMKFSTDSIVLVSSDAALRAKEFVNLSEAVQEYFMRVVGKERMFREEMGKQFAQFWGLEVEYLSLRNPNDRYSFVCKVCEDESITTDEIVAWARSWLSENPDPFPVEDCLSLEDLHTTARLVKRLKVDGYKLSARLEKLLVAGGVTGRVLKETPFKEWKNFLMIPALNDKIFQWVSKSFPNTLLSEGSTPANISNSAENQAEFETKKPTSKVEMRADVKKVEQKINVSTLKEDGVAIVNLPSPPRTIGRSRKQLRRNQKVKSGSISWKNRNTAFSFTINPNANTLSSGEAIDTLPLVIPNEAMPKSVNDLMDVV